MSSIVWLASYPKSGNTWMRAFLTNYMGNTEKPASINHLNVGVIASARTSFEELVGVEASDLTPTQIQNCRPMVYRLLATESNRTVFLKVHDAYQNTSAGAPMFPADVTLGVVYIIRHPCDVAISYAYHNGFTLERAVAALNDPANTLAGHQDRLDFQLEQKLLTWAQHVRSWLDSGLSCCVVRYEDMLDRPQETFSAAVRFVGLNEEPERLQRALQFSSFEELQAQEQRDNFTERSAKAPNFFRQGKAGTWRRILTEAQVDSIVNTNGSVMQQFGYLDTKGNVL
jgi:aryl sulfotransferase